MELLAEKTERMCGFRPEVEQIEKFIVEELVERSAAAVDRTSPSKKPAGTLGATRKGIANARKHAGSREISYRLFGADEVSTTAKEALITILREMAKHDRQFFDKLSQIAQGKRRNHLSRTREGVYPLRPDLADSAVEIAPGWWLGVNIANREKRRILERACEVLHIEYGKDLEITFPSV